MEKFTINGKSYFAKDLDFEYLVMLDKNGVSVNNVTGLAAINCFVSYCSGMDETSAAKEISQHVIGGGKLADVVDIYAKKLKESDFFRALMEQTENETEEVEEKPQKAPKKKSAVSE